MLRVTLTLSPPPIGSKKDLRCSGISSIIKLSFIEYAIRFFAFTVKLWYNYLMETRMKLRTITCIGCGKVVTEPMGHKRQYCSPECIKTRTVACIGCGKIITNPASYRRQHCSPECKEKYGRSGLYKERTITCVTCGTVVTKRMPAKINHCSVDCYRKSDRPQRKTGEDFSCTYCGKTFYIRASHQKNSENHFCCKEHADLYRGRFKTHHTCIVCSKEFTWSPSRSKNNNVKYCSLACRDKDPERTKMLHSMNLDQQSRKINKFEAMMYDILNELGVSYNPQLLIAEKFCVDAFVPSMNTVIQFDGDYWHGNFEKYTTLDSRQQKRARLDRSQDAYMAKLGYKVIRIWESDAKKSPDKVKELLRNALTR